MTVYMIIESMPITVFFRIPWLIKSLNLFEIEIFYSIINGFITFDKFNATLLNKSINLKKKKMTPTIRVDNIFESLHSYLHTHTQKWCQIMGRVFRSVTNVLFLVKTFSSSPSKKFMQFDTKLHCTLSSLAFFLFYFVLLMMPGCFTHAAHFRSIACSDQCQKKPRLKYQINIKKDLAPVWTFLLAVWTLPKCERVMWTGACLWRWSKTRVN